MQQQYAILFYQQKRLTLAQAAALAQTDRLVCFALRPLCALRSALCALRLEALRLKTFRLKEPNGILKQALNSLRERHTL
ncbi:MAG: hypothetical protein ACLFVO_09455 [Chloroflexaceae bacterium]